MIHAKGKHPRPCKFGSGVCLYTEKKNHEVIAGRVQGRHNIKFSDRKDLSWISFYHNKKVAGGVYPQGKRNLTIRLDTHFFQGLRCVVHKLFF